MPSLSAMREQVVVLPPLQAAGLCPRKAEEAVFSIPKEWVAPVALRSSQAVGIGRDMKSGEEEEASALDLLLAEKNVSRREDHSTGPLLETTKNEKVYKEDVTRNFPALSILQIHKESLSQGDTPLQWGGLKRSRCSRGPNHHRKPCDLPSAVTNGNVVASKENIKPKSGNIPRKRDGPCTPPAISADMEEDCKREKRQKSSDSTGERGTSIQGGKHAPQQTHQPEHVPHQTITRSSLGKKSASPERCVAALTKGIEAGSPRKEFAWPKFFITLSRKEIQEDLLIFRGSKPSRRPKRRSKAVERALLNCTPGNWLADVSHARYNVREKKCVKEKPRGLKAMESMDTDSE